MATADVRIVDPDSGDIGDWLPDWDGLSFSADTDGTGSLSFDYPRNGRHRDDMLDSGVLAVLIDGEEPRNLRYVRDSRDSNRVGDDRLTESLSFVALPQALEHAQFIQKGGTDPEKPVEEDWETRSWSDSTPGRVYAELLQQADDRGVLDWWGYQGHDFDDGQDSDGNDWEDRNTREHKYNQDVWTIVKQMVGDRQMKVGSHKGVLQAFNWGHGRQRDDIVLWAGRDLLDAPEQSSWAYAEGWELMQSTEVVDNVPEVFDSWRQGTVIRSWLLDLLVRALKEDANLGDIRGYAEDSGEGRWTVDAAIDLAVPVPAITAALFARFSSRQPESPAMKMVAAMRNQFGGHSMQAEGAAQIDQV